MNWLKYLIGMNKIACDVFGLPDFYTYFIAKKWQNISYYLIPFSLFADILVNFPLGTFFLIDIIAYILWQLIKRLIYYSNSPLVLYILRYSLLYFLGMGLFNIINQLCYCIFFIMINLFLSKRIKSLK